MCGQNTSRQWKSGNIQNQLTIPRATMIQSNQLGLVIIFFIGLSVNLSQNFACFYFTLTIDSWWWWLSKCQKCCRIWKKRSKVKKLRKRISFRFRMVSIIIKYTYICTKKNTNIQKKIENQRVSIINVGKICECKKNLYIHSIIIIKGKVINKKNRKL